MIYLSSRPNPDDPTEQQTLTTDSTEPNPTEDTDVKEDSRAQDEQMSSESWTAFISFMLTKHTLASFIHLCYFLSAHLCDLHEFFVLYIKRDMNIISTFESRRHEANKRLNLNVRSGWFCTNHIWIVEGERFISEPHWRLERGKTPKPKCILKTVLVLCSCFLWVLFFPFVFYEKRKMLKKKKKKVKQSGFVLIDTH